MDSEGFKSVKGVTCDPSTVVARADKFSLRKFARTSRYFPESAMGLLVIVCCYYCCAPVAVSAILVFDTTALLNEVLIPADAPVGSVIYRLRVSDTAFDYPLKFYLRDSTTVSLEALNCTRFNSVCQANLILRKKLEVGRFYDFRIEARNQKGESAVMNCSFQATNATTPIEKIFPGAPTLLTVSENARRNTELGTLIARGNPNRIKSVYMELYGTEQFGIHQKLITEKDAEGTIILLTPLDYEKKTVHHLTILANDPWTNMKEDTRNIAAWPLLVAVLDEQDTPPIFTIAPPTTTLSLSLKPGDTILRVHAEDGDRGSPRPIRYTLDADSVSSFFDISEKTGELTLALPISQVLSFPTQGQPILVKVTAEEVRSSSQEPPSQSTTVQLALIPPGITLGTPTFGAIEFHALLDENAPVGTVLDIPQAEISTEPGDIVTLQLENNNGTFDISPSVVEGFAKFRISVHNNRLLDYEARHFVECYIIAKELGKGNYSTRAKLTVVLNDVNDNPPQFVKAEFTGSVAELARVGTTVLIVEATDVDRQPGSKIRYTRLSGSGSEFFSLEPDTGVIKVANSNLDAETTPTFTLDVEAADEDGEGLTATAKVLITLIDVNDNPPVFEKDIFEFILNTDRTTFTSQAFVKAFDSDISSPNNEVWYELLTSNKDLLLNEKTGEISVKGTWNYDELVSIKVRAYDKGTPRLFTDAEVRLYPPEAKSRKMIFIVPGKYPDTQNTERTLSALTGSKVVVDEVRPYAGHEPGAAYVTRNEDGDKSVVVATVHYTKDSIVDINRIQQLLDDQNQQQNFRETNKNPPPNQQTDKNVKEKEETRIQQSGGGDLYWLLILFIILAILAAIILILCCICRPCPLYIPPKRKKIGSSGDVIEKMLIRGFGSGRKNKSVQVAEWFGRKEAWSAEDDRQAVHAATTMVDGEVEADSLRRHEMERGSVRGEVRHIPLREQHLQQSQSMQHLKNVQQQDLTRDQMYVREGNAEILRLVTRAGEPINRNSAPIIDQYQQHYLVDSGKDILMRRFIDQQQAEAARTQVLLPNAVTKLQTEQEFLEVSLRQQNALLRQLILDRERDLRLETQSLPAGTQTDQDMGTQTEPQYLLPPRRRVQSDLDASDYGSDEEIAVIKAKAKRRHRVMKPRKIKTPIQEEESDEMDLIEKYEKPYKQSSIEKIEVQKTSKPMRTSQSRQKTVSVETSASSRRSRSKSSRSGLRKEVLKEISVSLDQSEESDRSYYNKKKPPPEIYSEDSLEEDISPRSEKTTDSGKYRHRSESTDPSRSRRSRSESVEYTKRKASLSPQNASRQRSLEPSHIKQRFKSETDLRSARATKKASATTDQRRSSESKSQSQLDLSSERSTKREDKAKKGAVKRSSRYMEWYTKKQNGEVPKTEKPDRRKSDAEIEKLTKPAVVESRLFKETIASSGKKSEPATKKNMKSNIRKKDQKKTRTVE
ncbi:cadherin-86C isoform X2 [Anthonomus grandis grandis]|uniref:cadherin-86C isoform X2 n=1 Tax=Anthonomus grandis grandis TaxID=2921223 RepID=UPI0021658700|nr:cadherin-86C isoform X2 [Anthonomus grandis grandis]